MGKIKVRWNLLSGPGVIQIRAISTAGVEVDVLVTEDQIYGIAEALKTDSLPTYEKPPDRWRAL